MKEVELAAMMGVTLRPATVFSDSRGSFTRLFEREPHRSSGFDPNFNTIALSITEGIGTIRGLHFQSPPFEEEKSIYCLEGKISEVLVDLREGSITLGKWAMLELSAAKPAILAIPKGFAHGYQTLTQTAKVLYGLTSDFEESHSYSLDYADSSLGIEWQLPVTQVSKKDSSGISLQDAVKFFPKG